MADESDAEKQLRLYHEQRCRRIADLVKAELPEDRGFILLTAQRGPAGEGFSSADYVATVRPQDSLRLLREHIARLTARTGIMGEPTEETSTVLREHVFSLLEGLAGAPPPTPDKVWRSFCRARKGEGSYRERATAFTALAVVALVELEHLQRAELRAPRYERPPPERSDADLAAEEILRHAAPRDPNVPRGDTKTTLVGDLREKPPSAIRDRLISRALAGHFHDYESESATPKVLLHGELVAAGYPDLAQKVIACAYDDEPPTVEQEENLRQEVGPALFDAMMNKSPRGQS